MQMVCLHTVDPTSLLVDSTGYVGKGVVLNWLLNFLAHPHIQKNAVVPSLFCFSGFVGVFFPTGSPITCMIPSFSMESSYMQALITEHLISALSILKTHLTGNLLKLY